MREIDRHHRLGCSVRRVALAGLLGATVACSGPARLEAVTLLQQGQCQGLTDGARLITYAELAQLRGSNLLSMTDPEGDAEGDGDDPLLVAVSRGPQPTAGYSLALDSATLDHGTAVLTVRWETPAAGSMQAQVITHPCLVVAVPRAPVERVRVVDQSEAVIGELGVDAQPASSSRAALAR
jgi:hypothetical protein